MTLHAISPLMSIRITKTIQQKNYLNHLLAINIFENRGFLPAGRIVLGETGNGIEIQPLLVVNIYASTQLGVKDCSTEVDSPLRMVLVPAIDWEASGRFRLLVGKEDTRHVNLRTAFANKE
jgi:hypothetical protein